MMRECNDDAVDPVASDHQMPPVSSRLIAGKLRVMLAIAGLSSWAAGGVASFRSSNGAGTAALVAAGVVCGLLSFIGRWPTRISVSGNEASWSEIDETVVSQIRAALANGEGQGTVAELEILQARLRELQQTGEVPPHPAEVYDRQVDQAIKRTLIGAEVIRQKGRSNALADFLVRYHGRQVYVETKWRSDTTRPYRGSTLQRLLDGLEVGARLLIVVNIPSIGPEATEFVNGAVGRCVRIVTWRGPQDDEALHDSFDALLTD
jgi:hypothetical protein